MPGTDKESHKHCHVGDLESDAAGSGARKNEGKPQMDLVPVIFWAEMWAHQLAEFTPEEIFLLASLEEWQQGDDGALSTALVNLSMEAMLSAVEVLEFGAKKYKAWNWAKGMAWSVPTGCILRHYARIAAGEKVDRESGLPHFAHIVCNTIMLEHFRHYYKEGDDRPPRL